MNKVVLYVGEVDPRQQGNIGLKFSVFEFEWVYAAAQTTFLQLSLRLDPGFERDPVESLFSCFRQFNGGNDKVDARTAVFTAEKLLKVGILQAAKSGNAPHSSETNAPLKPKARDGDTTAMPLAVVLGAKRLSHELEFLHVSFATPDDIELAPLAYLAGYLARACEEKLTCEACKVLLQEPKPCGGMYDFIKKIENGQLRYPKMEI
ncbi:hypothetical protein HPB52_021469 [Rhipicephalus sanguineus]|uniref:Uncharacterized protein n=1 Tax=Rhipicephalus sanguineus TaxID=34632 RepID=A0A9D4SUX4_RHISA|nr:hypothetical protein HPB52_021469 [Rhipicephalus sanguineus]